MTGGVQISGIIVPGIVFIAAFLITYLLYRHFTKRM